MKQSIFKNIKFNTEKGFTPTPSLVSLESVSDIFLDKFKHSKKSFFKTFFNSPTKTQHKTWCLGFTLIELMVATSIFVVIMLAAMGSLMAASATSKRAQQLQTSMDNVNFAMESMTRSIRIGRNYICKTGIDTVDLNTLPSSPIDCPSGGYLVAFIPATTMNLSGSKLIAYKLDGTSGTGVLERCTDNSTCVPITSSDVNITTLKFYVVGADNTTVKIQPSVYITMKGTVTIKGQASSFAIQTMASQRSSE